MRPRALDSDSSLAVLCQGRRRFVAAAEVSAGDRARYEELRDTRILDLDRGIYRASHIALCSRYQLPAPPILPHDRQHAGPKRVLAMLARFDGAYLRFAGALDVEHHRGTALLEEHSNQAIWELMYFGHAQS
jgi:hypothetical protein